MRWEHRKGPLLTPGAEGSARSYPCSSASFPPLLPASPPHPPHPPLSFRISQGPGSARPGLVGGQVSLRVKVFTGFFLAKASPRPSPPVFLLGSSPSPHPPGSADRPRRGGRTTWSQLPVFVLELMFSSGPIPSPRPGALLPGRRLAAGCGSPRPTLDASPAPAFCVPRLLLPVQAHSPPRLARSCAHVSAGSPVGTSPEGLGLGGRDGACSGEDTELLSPLWLLRTG